MSELVNVDVVRVCFWLDPSSISRLVGSGGHICQTNYCRQWEGEACIYCIQRHCIDIFMISKGLFHEFIVGFVSDMPEETSTSFRLSVLKDTQI